jgi:hypothetical protein
VVQGWIYAIIPALGPTEGPQVDELVVMVPVVVVVSLVLRGKLNWNCQRSEQPDCDKAHRESGFHKSP